MRAASQAVIEIDGYETKQNFDSETLLCVGTIRRDGRAHKFSACRIVFTDKARQPSEPSVMFRGTDVGAALIASSKLPEHKHAVLTDSRVRSQLRMA